jgi:chemotaxis methyl-accepting protein methylase
MPDLDAYADFLERRTREIDAFIETLSTRVTRFFRNPSFFEFLDRRVLPAVLSRQGDPAVQLWSAGCSTGEEAYSIAMLLASRDLSGRAGILATDIDRKAMAIARAAEYPQSESACIPRRLAARFLVTLPRHRVGMAPEAARRVVLRRADIFNGPRRPTFDLIVCRNVLIYFEPEHQRELLLRFVSALRTGGFLALGRAERVTGPARESLVTVSASERFYRRN